MAKNNHQPFIMEIAVISAQGLKKHSSSTLFSHRLRPFITLSTAPPYSCRLTNEDKRSHLYKTKVDDEGGINPTWGDKFQLPIDATFLYQRHSCLYLQLYTKRLMMGQTQLGWCQIPAADVVDGLLPVGSVRHLSYRLRERDGSRGQGVVNIAVKLEGSFPVVCPQRPLISDLTHLPEMGLCQTVIGFPVTMLPANGWVTGECQSSISGSGQLGSKRPTPKCWAETCMTIQNTFTWCHLPVGSHA